MFGKGHKKEQEDTNEFVPKKDFEDLRIKYVRTKQGWSWSENDQDFDPVMM